MSRIRVLPDHLINQIAAGEVIERPASVVKELLENAIDAGARSIRIDIEAGGRRRIRVADDGEGLDKDDALLALERHATSKLRAASDLGHIMSLGFRGEALPAIASVSRLTLMSSRDGRAGTRVEVEAGRIRQVDEAGHPRGTTMDVRDLFFNTPARAKFLRSPQTELGHISDLVESCVVSIPAVTVTLAHEGRDLIEALPASDEHERIRQMFGTEWRDAILIEATKGQYSLRGLLCPPGAAASSRRAQHLYVNGRLVRDRLVGHAIMAACQGFLPKDRHAAVFLFITCPPEAVDVNVHPAKAEVRFGDTRAVHDLVQGAILGALRGAMPITALGDPAGAASLVQEEPAFGMMSSRNPRDLHEATQAYIAGGAAREYTQASRIESPALPAMDEGAVALAHYRESYIIAADREGLLIVDQHAAHERILYERIVAQARDEGGIGRQRLLFPITAQMPRLLASRVEQVVGQMDRLGVTVEPFGDGTLKVTETPAILDASGIPDLMNDLLGQMCEEPLEDGHLAAPVSPRGQRLMATVACHAATRARMPLTTEKMNYLINELFRTVTPLKCPHGRPAVLRFSHESIEKGFDRR